MEQVQVQVQVQSVGVTYNVLILARSNGNRPSDCTYLIQEKNMTNPGVSANAYSGLAYIS